MNDESNVAPKGRTKTAAEPKPVDPFLNKPFVDKLHVIDGILQLTVNASNQAWIQERICEARRLLKLMWENE